QAVERTVREVQLRIGELSRRVALVVRCEFHGHLRRRHLFLPRRVSRLLRDQRSPYARGESEPGATVGRSHWRWRDRRFSGWRDGAGGGREAVGPGWGAGADGNGGTHAPA